MPDHLPSLNALRAFEAVARHLSFTKAADDLNVTRAAVSHQIKHLEDFLGFQLVERRNRSIALTPAALASLPKLREGFNNVADAVHLMRAEIADSAGINRVTVWTTPSFASKWLIPRLPHFSQLYPHIDLDINAKPDMIDRENTESSLEELFRTQTIDIMIRFGIGNYPGCITEKLLSSNAVPLCSPHLVNDHDHPLKKPKDLKHHNLLHDETAYMGRPTWDKWLKKAGVKNINTHRGMHFNFVSMGLQAAIDGQGVLLSMDTLAKYDIDAGRLCIPFDIRMPLKTSHYIVRSEQSTNNPSVNIVNQWLHNEAVKLRQQSVDNV